MPRYPRKTPLTVKVAPPAVDADAEPTPTQWLARRCAERGLRLSDARALFEALYIADALVLEHGNISAAARRAGLNYRTIQRRRGR